MVQHVILWTLKPEAQGATRAQVAQEIKRRLEALVGVVPGLLSAQVFAQPLPSSNADVMLISTLADEAALALYKDHPAHVEAATYVRSVVVSRTCMDCIN